MTLRYTSICSGIEAASVAWEPLGWRPVLFAEIDAFARAVLAHRQRGVDARRTGAARRGVPLWGDFTALRARHLRRMGIERPDLLVGGTPCQAFSVAGLRQSLDDARGNLTLDFVRLVHAIAPRWVVWENVPGVLRTDDNAFGCFVAGLVGAGAAIDMPGGGRWPNAGMAVGPRRAVAWRILDAQHFGLAQRRRRVFVVSCRAGDGINPGAVLFEPEGVRRRDRPGRPAGAVASALSASGVGVHGADDNAAQANHLIAVFGGNNTAGPISLSPALTAHGGPSGRIDFESEAFVVSALADLAPTLRAEGFDASEDGTGRVALIPVAYRTAGDGAVYHEGCRTAPLTTGTDRVANVVALMPRGDAGPVAAALRRLAAGDDPAAIVEGLIRAGVTLRVRRMTPVEWERLQGFPDGYTDIPWRGRAHAPDGPRYKSIGNSMPTAVMRWLGERIQAVEAALAGRGAP